MSTSLFPTASQVLQVLRAGPSYGLEIIERVQKSCGGTILFPSTVYPLLRELEEQGYLESYEGDPLPERGDRPRRYYKLTEAGLRAAGGT